MYPSRSFSMCLYKRYRQRYIYIFVCISTHTYTYRCIAGWNFLSPALSSVVSPYVCWFFIKRSKWSEAGGGCIPVLLWEAVQVSKSDCLSLGFTALRKKTKIPPPERSQGCGNELGTTTMHLELRGHGLLCLQDSWATGSGGTGEGWTGSPGKGEK